MKLYGKAGWIAVAAITIAIGCQSSLDTEVPLDAASPTVLHKTTEIDGLEVFYREAGPEGISE